MSNLKNSIMKSVFELLMKIVKSAFPKSRWGNVVYLIIGFLAGNWDAIVELFKQITVK